MKLITFNEERTKAWWAYLKNPKASVPAPINSTDESNVKNGLRCNTCGGELVDVQANAVANTFPARVAVRCIQCGISEWRVL